MIDQDDVPDNEEEEEITRDDLWRHYHDIENVTKTVIRPGVYRHAADRRFPDSKRGYLSIIAEDYTYTMDIMFINFVVEENILKEKISQKKNICQMDCTRTQTSWQLSPLIGGLF